MPRVIVPRDLHKDPHKGGIKTVAIGVVVNSRGHVLLARRAKPPFEGYWEGFGGGIELGETIEQALLRELREETGLVDKHVKRKAFAGFDEHIVPPHYHRIRFVYGVLVHDNAPIKLGEHAETKWFPASRLPPKVFPRYAPLIRKAVRAVKAGK